MPFVFELLKEDHRTVESLFQQYEQSPDPALALKICDELTIHATLEEEMVYPMIGANVGTHEVKEARDEHQQAKDLISQIEQAVRSGEDPTPIVQQLKQANQHHVQEEENELFPKVEAVLPEQLSHMGDELVDRKAQLKEQVAEARSLDMPITVVQNKPVTK